MTSPDPKAADCEALEPAARAVLSEAAYNYYAGGAEDETTLRAVQESPGPPGLLATPTPRA